MTSAAFLHDYAASPGVYDEMCTATGDIRPHWQALAQTFNTLGPAELTRRWEQARRLLHEHGVTYNVYSDPQGMHRPWELDAMPLLIAPAEWQCLERALIQRVRLLTLLLQDVYGPQRLLQQGLIPPELVFAHAGFLRPCHGLHVPQDIYLHLYAADLVRAADGQWWILADRTQNPSGAGYALENRLILSRTLSEAFHECRVQRLAMFYDSLRQTLRRLAPHRHDNPRIVLLTPGPYNETYFEHVYLARYLGYTLVEGADLTVRDNRVFLKTLAGLQPVDVILRRQDDVFCDPLELRQDSVLGVAGLVQAARLGHVTIANALGSGWLETPALLPLLPRLCQHFFGEDLLLPSVPTWWCGQEDNFQYVVAYLDSLAVLPAFFPTNGTIINKPAEGITAQRQLLAKMRSQPYAFVAQGLPALSTTPVWHDGHLQPRSTVWRVYVTATEDGYAVMPGGLTRVATLPSAPSVSMQHSGRSKDTWVLSQGPPNLFSLLPPAGQLIELRRSGYELPSRVADNLFWLGRYVERAEAAVRFLRAVLHRLTDDTGSADSGMLPPLQHAVRQLWEPLRHRTRSPVALVGPALDQALFAALFDLQWSGSVRKTLDAGLAVAAMVRDRISSDSWRILTLLGQDFQPPQHHPWRWSDALDLLNRTIITLAAFSGLGVENMTRGPGWHFLDMGRRLERAMHMTIVLHSLLVQSSEYEGAVLETLLEIADSTITYRSRYLAALQLAPVLDLVLTDESNPRAVVYQLLALSEHVENLPRDRSRPSLTPAQRLVLGALNSLRLVEIETVCLVDDQGCRTHLETLLTQLRTDLPALSDTIMHHYLSHAEPSRHLASSGLASSV